ncbi:RsiV family protein [Bradyrhizobium brasilense]|uniref:RsiV family protein n=1 Tax=Bradyrhizobium brasilense TaxID=1419277 RepID=UPI001E4A29EB|nr:RsiV family protein [Bradyrhizobium brasilense]
MTIIVKWAVALISGFVFISLAIAANPKPDATIRNANIEANVYLDDKIKADSALAADCLGEGKKWIDKNAAEAAADRKQEPDLFKDRGGYSFERKYSERSVVDGRYVSVLRDDYMDTHGAHPNSDVNTILWDTTAKKRISIRPFFTETADNGPALTAMRKAIVSALNAEKKRRGAGETATAEWYKELKPSLLTFHYPPYAVGPYAEGQYVIFVPWETLKPYLTPEGAKIFAGARPKGDADEQQ